MTAVGSTNNLVGPEIGLTSLRTELASMEDMQEDSIKQRLRNSPRYPARTPDRGSRMADDATGPSELQEPEPVIEQGATSSTELREEFRELLAVTKQEITSMTRDMMKEMIHEIQYSWQARTTDNQQITNPTVVENVRDAFQSRGSNSTLSSRPEFQNRQSNSILSSRPEFQGHRGQETAIEAETNSHWQLPGSEYQSGPMQNSSRLNASNYIKLPPFTGKERWDIWYNRFVDVANLRGWNDEQSLLELLPRLQSPAGEFVYGQLSSQTRREFRHLVQELNARFRVVETSKTYRALFSNRDQRIGESVESYAAELKRLYDKAYTTRDLRTRSEDLLRRFLDGLSDEAARFHVEYIKDPADIDHAVYEVVNFQETKRKQGKREATENKTRRPARQARFDSQTEMVSPSEEDDEDDDEETSEHVARAPKRTKTAPITNIIPDEKARCTESPKGNEHSTTHPLMTKEPGSQVQDFNKVLNKILSKLDTLGKNSSPNTQKNPRMGAVQSQGHPGNRNNNSRTPRRQYECYNCGMQGHFARECPTAPWVTGQMHMTMQPGAPAQPITFSHATNNQGLQSDHPGPNYQHMGAGQTSSSGTNNQALN